MNTTLVEKHAGAKMTALIGMLMMATTIVAMIVPHHDALIGWACAASCVINALNAVSAKRRSTGLAGAFTTISVVSFYGAITMLAPQIVALFVH